MQVHESMKKIDVFARQKTSESMRRIFYKNCQRQFYPLIKNHVSIVLIHLLMRIEKNIQTNIRIPYTKTVYTLIDQGVLLVKNINLPIKTRIRPRKKKSSEPKDKNAKYLSRSIEKREPSILLREELGHWEVDLVLGKKRKGKSVIITMVERKTPFLIMKKCGVCVPW